MEAITEVDSSNIQKSIMIFSLKAVWTGKNCINSQNTALIINGLYEKKQQYNYDPVKRIA